MTTLLKTWFRALTAVLAIGFASAAMAQETDKPAITIKTSSYDTNGESNMVTILIGGMEAGSYIDLDCGFGTEEHELAVAELEMRARGAALTCRATCRKKALFASMPTTLRLSTYSMPAAATSAPSRCPTAPTCAS